MVVQRTNYVEAVGLILLGFGIYETIFGLARAGSSLVEWGPQRSLLVIVVCLAVVITLTFLQNLQFGEKDFEIDHESGKRVVRFWSPKLWKLIVVLSIQMTLPYMLALMFSGKQGYVFAIGFLFIDFSILVQRQAAKSK